jgi:hypothetical protein
MRLLRNSDLCAFGKKHLRVMEIEWGPSSIVSTWSDDALQSESVVTLHSVRQFYKQAQQDGGVLAEKEVAGTRDELGRSRPYAYATQTVARRTGVSASQPTLALIALTLSYNEDFVVRGWAKCSILHTCLDKSFPVWTFYGQI